MAVRPNSPAARDVAFQLHPYTNARRHEDQGPMIIEQGKGVYVFDDQGKEYIEGLAGLWSVGLGFGEERLVQAAADNAAGFAKASQVLRVEARIEVIGVGDAG